MLKWRGCRYICLGRREMLLMLCFQHGGGGVLIYHWQTEWSLTGWRGAVMKTYIQMNECQGLIKPCPQVWRPDHNSFHKVCEETIISESQLGWVLMCLNRCLAAERRGRASVGEWDVMCRELPLSPSIIVKEEGVTGWYITLSLVTLTRGLNLWSLHCYLPFSWYLSSN